MPVKIKNWLTATKKMFMRIKLVDRCLIMFMVILMAQSTYNLFVNECVSQETNTIDIVVRTTSAAIFGYFLSANFIKKPTKKSEEYTPPLSTASCDTPQYENDIKPKNQIGFAPQPLLATELSTQSAVNMPKEPLESETSHQQIIIATGIGLFALITIIFARNFLVLTPSAVSTISQMRDFVSGCVGFLLGSPGTDNRKA